MTLRTASAPPLPVRTGPAINPMMLARPMLLPVLDTNVLLTHACWLVKNGYQHDKVTALADSGRTTPYIAAHVPAEIDEHLARLADDYHVAERHVRRLLGAQILPALRVVDLEIRDHLSPQTRRILHVEREMPKRYGDPDDAPTMALAEFLGPSVIVTEDGVFARSGFAVIEWVPAVQSLLRMADLEATAADALSFIGLALRLFGAGAHRMLVLGGRNPLLATAFVAGLLGWCYHRGYLRRDNWRRSLSRAGEAAAPLLEMIDSATVEHQSLSDALLVVNPPAYPTREQLAAQYLARCGRSLTPSELRDALARRGHYISAAQLKRDMLAHRAFVRAPGDLWTVGRPVAGFGA
ncbi:PIN domain-containing protein [Streptomyces sp. SID13726]|uniref:PIN domain-containing protein n=1 Tax=Streptomyces sp. SID13726 TaxID=2706058 RepID=UPI0013BB428A|nr:PIN domain-containing protein [Streptomyces sp. SID13726]NEB01890.1 PIN domain-containing protein [Streptomyces sp. SID13726]